MSAVAEVTDVRMMLEELAPLFEYPVERLVPPADHSAPPELHDFVREAGTLDVRDLQAVYTSTFDLAPSCSPYLGLHLFGEEGRDRARLMVGLRLAYRRWGGDTSRELPDHVSEVIGAATKYDEDEWRELCALVLVPALAKMNELLSDTANPYRHLVAAARRLAAQESSIGGES